MTASIPCEWSHCRGHQRMEHSARRRTRRSRGYGAAHCQATARGVITVFVNAYINQVHRMSKFCWMVTPVRYNITKSYWQISKIDQAVEDGRLFTLLPTLDRPTPLQGYFFIKSYDRRLNFILYQTCSPAPLLEQERRASWTETGGAWTTWRELQERESETMEYGKEHLSVAWSI